MVPVGREKRESPSWAPIKPFSQNITQKGGVADHFREERRPRPFNTAAINLGSGFGTCICRSPSSTSPQVSHGSGSSRRMTSEKLSPGAFSFCSRV